MNRDKKNPNKLREVREEMMISKAELARRAGVSALTIDRIENGENCRVDTKRKIILALGLKLNEKEKVFATEAERIAHERAKHLASEKVERKGRP